MYKRFLIVVDDQPNTQTAIRHGVEMARIHCIEVLFLYVLPNYTFSMVDVPAMAAMSALSAMPVDQFNLQAKEAAAQVLLAATTHAETMHVPSKQIMGSDKDAAEYVVEVAKKSECDLIVVASEGENAVMRLLTGSIVPGLITKSPVPVMVCPHEDTTGAGVDQMSENH